MGGSQSKVSGQKLYDSYLKDQSKLNDLSGKVVAITGTSPGSIGFYIAQAATMKKANCVLLLNRQSERSAKAEKALKALAPNGTKVQSIPIDLLSFDAVKKAAEEVNRVSKENGGLDVLCCNAGVMAMNDDRTVDGFNLEIQADHLSHYLLTKLCMGSLEQAAASRGEARVVYQSSSGRYGNELEKKYFEKSEPMTLGGNGSAIWTRYHMAKLANSAFAMGLHDALQEKGSKVKSIGCEPGYATSNLQSNSQRMGWGMMLTLNIAYMIGAAQSPADGSLPASVASFGPGVKSGDFWLPGGKMNFEGAPTKTVSEGKPVKQGGEKETVSENNKKLIMEVSAEAFGFPSFL